MVTIKSYDMKSFTLFPVLFFLVACSSGTPEYDATGTFEATDVVVSAEASGKILGLDVEEGTILKAGQEAGIIDTVQLYLKKLQLEAGVKSVEGQRPDILKQVAATKEQIVQAQRERDRVANLLRVGAANQKQLDDAESLLKVLRKQLAAQNSTLQNSDQSLTWQSSSVGIQVAQVEDQLKKCHIVAPLTGTVLAKYAEAGELAAPGTPLFKMADMEQIYLRAYITSEQLSEVKLGQKVTVYADYGKDVRTAYPGVVTWISDSSEFTPKTILTKDERANLVYAVKVAVKNDGMLKIGMYGEWIYNSSFDTVMDFAVTVDNVFKRYGQVEALQGVSLSVRPGELFGIIGPDGAGKRLCSVFLPPCCLPMKARLRYAGWIW